MPISPNSTFYLPPNLDMDDMRKHVARRWEVGTIICATEHEPPHMAWVKARFGEEPIERWIHHVSVMTPKTAVSKKDSQWVDGFPHVHSRPKSFTMITYVGFHCEGGALVVWDGKEESCKVYQPLAGLVVVTDGIQKHGVEVVKKGTRMAIHTTGVYK